MNATNRIILWTAAMLGLIAAASAQSTNKPDQQTDHLAGQHLGQHPDPYPQDKRTPFVSVVLPIGFPMAA